MANRRSYSTESIVHAINTPIAEGELPNEIQYLPPGEHNITASKNGKPADLTLEITAKTADLLQSSYEKITADGREQVFIDFNHNDEEASGWVEGFYWAGDDPDTGGVRAKISWTNAGQEALEGKNYRKFSPTFTLNSKGQIDGTTLNAGGLVNRPAFKDITPVIAKDDDQLLNKNMDDKTKAQDGDDQKKVAANTSDDQKKVAATDGGSNDEKIKALEEENKELKAKLKAMEDDKDESSEAQAKSAVERAVEDGRIPAKDDEVRAKWVSTLKTDPSAIALLESLPKNPALQRVVQAKRVNGQSAFAVEVEQQRQVDDYKAKNGCSFEQAWEAVRATKPELFNHN